MKILVFEVSITYFCNVNLAIDIGNTLIKAAIFQDGELIDFERFEHQELAKLSDWANRYTLSKVAIADVAGVSEEWKDSSFVVNPFRVTSLASMPININYETPQLLGVDRIALAVAAYSESDKTVPTLVVSCGSCLTFEYVVSGTYQGGAISPGFMMRLKAMHTQTGKLPLLEPENMELAIGKSTTESMLSGVFNGMKAEIDARLSSFYKDNPTGKAFITGGDGFRFANALKNPIFADNFLAVKGINQILDYQ